MPAPSEKLAADRRSYAAFNAGPDIDALLPREAVARLAASANAIKRPVRRATGWWWADPLVALGIGEVALREARDAWRGGGCDCCA